MTQAAENPTDRRARERAEQQEAARDRRKAEQAVIVTALQSILEEGEQVLAFARGRVAGGWRGKLALGPEAFFAPFVNIGLTERRVIFQHILAERGTPSHHAPHAFPITDVADVRFADIETFGGEKAARLTLRLASENHIRLRLRGDLNCEDARAFSDVFHALTDRGTKPHRPTETICPNCAQVMEQPFKFCPYCGAVQPPLTAAATASPESVVQNDISVFDISAETADPASGTDSYEEPAQKPLSDAIAAFAVATQDAEAAPSEAQENAKPEGEEK